MSITVHSSVFSGGSTVLPDSALYPSATLYPGSSGGSNAVVAVSTTVGPSGQQLSVSLAGGNATLSSSGLTDGQLREILTLMPTLSE